MSNLLSIGASGVRAYQTALTTTSENIANAATPGYVRRSAVIGEVQTGGGYSSGVNGQGAEITGVRRSANPYADTAVRNASADLSRTETGSVWMQRIETALSSGGVPQRLTAFFAAGTALQADPTSTALRSGMLSAATTAADSFGITARALDSAMSELDATASLAVDDLTRLGQAMLKVNQGLARTEPGTGAAAQLTDQRETLLDQMSELADISVTYDQAGRATVKMGGITGPTLVDTRDANRVAYQRTGGNAAVMIQRGDNTTTTFDPDGGKLAGFVEGAQRIGGARTDLESVADDFTSTVNDLQTQGKDLSGAAGTKFFTTSADPTAFSVALTSGDQIAASRGTGETRDASNLIELAKERVSQKFEARAQTIITSNAATLKQRQIVGDAQTAIRDGAETTRSEISGVNFDNEAIDLMRFQQAYQASSRVIQVAKETFQSILEIR